MDDHTISICVLQWCASCKLKANISVDTIKRVSNANSTSSIECSIISALLRKCLHLHIPFSGKIRYPRVKSSVFCTRYRPPGIRIPPVNIKITYSDISYWVLARLQAVWWCGSQEPQHEIETRNRDTKTRHEIETRKRNTKSRYENETRNRNMQRHENEIRSRNTKTRHENETRNRNTEAKHESSARKRNTKTRHENETRKRDTKTRHEIEARKRDTKPKHENETRKRNTQTKHENETSQEAQCKNRNEKHVERKKNPIYSWSSNPLSKLAQKHKCKVMDGNIMVSSDVYQVAYSSTLPEGFAFWREDGRKVLPD
eukprot:g62973.t1